jgi:hypothetical protein
MLRQAQHERFSHGPTDFLGLSIQKHKALNGNVDMEACTLIHQTCAAVEIEILN